MRRVKLSGFVYKLLQQEECSVEAWQTYERVEELTLKSLSIAGR